MTLPGLPGAGAEVAAIADQIPGTTVLLDQAFTADALRSRAADHNILHIASNAAFVSGAPADSFILMGNGERVTLQDLDTWNLGGVELVVLSASETGLGGPELEDGREILGFGYQVQRAGARAAIASLWQVSDGGTQALMMAFYQALSEGYSAAAALQRSQRRLISGNLGIGNGVESAGGDLSHPYYWAPFVLMGNGL